MTRFAVIEARPWHCGQIARLLRYEHLQAMARLGRDPHRELRACFDMSAFRKAWTIDGRLAALGGVTGTALSSDGMIWLAVSEEATKFPVAMIAEARRQLDGLMRTKRVLTSALLAGDRQSARFAVFLGFTGPLQGERAESRFGRRFVLSDLDNEEARHPLGNGYTIPVAYCAA